VERQNINYGTQTEEDHSREDRQRSVCGTAKKTLESKAESCEEKEMTRRNPIVNGRMYKVAGGGSIKGVRFREGGRVEVLVQPKAKRTNPTRKKTKKRRPAAKKRRPKTNKKPRSNTTSKANKKRVSRRPKAKKKK
jgi:hypothetical protein